MGGNSEAHKQCGRHLPVSTSEISNSPEDDATQIPMSQMSALFADTSGDMNDVMTIPIAGCSGANEGSTPMPMMELTSPERRMTADRRVLGVLECSLTFAKAMVEQGRAGELAIPEQGNDIMQETLDRLCCKRMGSSDGKGAGGFIEASAPEVSITHLACPSVSAVPARLVQLLAQLQISVEIAAEVTYPTLAEGHRLGVLCGRLAPLPSQVEELMMVGRPPELCCTQVACQESQPMHKRVEEAPKPEWTCEDPPVPPVISLSATTTGNPPFYYIG
uniref:Uncharacterized protein n=1 Tax=Sphaerodactylus townsendi TaxID=933632 RepID=A0ACB8EN15_9SAUR